MPYADVPAFMQRLRERNSASARALEFVILTAARSGEARLATWDEIVDLDGKQPQWVLPAERMKKGKQHEVPLSKQAVALLKSMPRIGDYIFPGQVQGSSLSDMAMRELLKGMDGNGFVPHGFRSSFRDWAGDLGRFDREVIEHALAHQLPDATERAYRRGTAMPKRKVLMQAWADYCDGRLEFADNVVSMNR